MEILCDAKELENGSNILAPYNAIGSNGPIYKIALIQLYSVPLEMEANFLKASSFITSAALRGADLAVLPEFHLTGWTPNDPQFIALASKGQIYLSRYQSLAKACKINIVPGTIIRASDAPENQEDKLYNVAYFINNEGEVIGSYSKKNLWHPERSHLASSTHEPHEVIETPLGKVGLLICWDLAFPEAFRELIMNGAKIIIIPSFWLMAEKSSSRFIHNPLSEKIFIDSAVVSRAFENTCAIIYVNAGGPSSMGYVGQSQVAIPFEGPVGKIEGSDEGMIIVNLNSTIVDEAEGEYKVRADLAREDWHYHYRHSHQ